MNQPDRPLPLAMFGVASFATVWLCVSLTRYDDGAAYVWFASAILIAELSTRPRRCLHSRLLIYVIASAIAIGVANGNWISAVPLSLGTMLEGVVGAALLRRMGIWQVAPSTVQWIVRFSVAVGLVAPAVGAAGVAGAATLGGLSFWETFERCFTAHALGNLTFIPLIRVLIVGGAREFIAGLVRDGKSSAAVLLALVTATTTAAFLQVGLPLLFVPTLPVVLTCFRLGYSGAALSVLLVATIGGSLTVLGRGPLELIDGGIGEKLQFFQLYLTSLSLVALPIAAELHARADLLRSVQISEARYRLLADYSTDILMHIDPAGQVLYASPSIERFMDFEAAALSAGQHKSFIAPEDMPLVRQGHAATLAAGGETVNFEYRGFTRNGELRWLEAHSRAIVHDDGLPAGVITVLRDVSDRKFNELRLMRDATTDPLTGLVNRRGLEAAVGGKGGDCIAVFDIDHFKRVNDAHGHDAGDGVLQIFARLMQQAVREGDIVARLGGEEFAILFPSTSINQALAICERLRIDVAAQAIVLTNVTIRISVSGGVAAVHNGDLKRALKHADEALYSAKRGGRDQLALAA